MAHYAFINEDNIVTEVITGIDETELIEGLDTETWYANYRGQSCKRTSYHGSYRYNFAGIGYVFDAEGDAFIAPKPDCGHAELKLNKTNYRWECESATHEFKTLAI